MKMDLLQLWQVLVLLHSKEQMHMLLLQQDVAMIVAVSSSVDAGKGVSLMFFQSHPL